jgi:PhnB protein
MMAFVAMIQPELWVDRGATAVAFYRSAFGANVLHQVGEGEDIVAQLEVDGALFWVAAASGSGDRKVPRQIAGATARFLLVVNDPHDVHANALGAGAANASDVHSEHGWTVGRVVDPFGHEWEIGHPDHG